MIIFQAGAPKTVKISRQPCRRYFTHQESLAEAQAFYRDVKSQLDAYGRREGELHIFRGVSVIVGDSADDVGTAIPDHRRAGID